MKNITLFSIIALGAALSVTSSRGADEVSREDKEFLKNASEMGITEVEIGKLAAVKATSPELKALGIKLLADHRESNKELVALAASKGVELKIEPTSTQKQMLASFELKTGAEFDKELMEHVRKDHEKGIKTFADAAADSKDPAIKAFALKNVSALKEHYKMSGGAVVHEH